MRVLGQYRKVYSGEEELRYVANDQVGSCRVTYDSTGVVEDYFSYSAFGEKKHSPQPNEYLAHFTGKGYDASGLIYFNARYYDPEVGRFLTEDPSRKGTSWYTYCSNNPLGFTDPTGRRLSESGSDIDETERQITRAAATPQTGDRRKDRRDVDRGARDLFRNPFATPGYDAFANQQVTWEASFVEASVGFLAAAVGGLPAQEGIARVHFTNLETGASFEASYTFRMTEVQGAAAAVGSGLDFGAVYGEFPRSATPQVIARSFKGDFGVVNVTVPVGPTAFGISVSAITSSEWAGSSYGGGVGLGGGISVQTLEYSMPFALTPMRNRQPNYMSREEANRVVNAFRGH